MKTKRIIREDRPLPEQHPAGRKPVYPWRELKPNSVDSFLATGVKINTMTSLATLAAQRLGGGIRFVCRSEAEGIRVWRVS